MAQSDEEDDYMNMVFEDAPKGPKFETSLQRAARKRKEGEARAHQKTKAERAEEAEAAREAALATALPETNKGFKMMAKFGFKQGDALGKSEHARKEPIRVNPKDDRGGIGLESEKKRKFREQFEEADRLAKRAKEEEGDYLDVLRQEQKEKKAERDLESAQRTAERLSDKDVEKEGTPNPAEKPLKDINVLWRTQARRRADMKRDKQQRRELNDSIASRLPTLAPEEEDDDSKVAQGRDLAPFYTTLENDLVDEDPELAEFEALPVTERLQKLLLFLRDKYRYCLYCGYEYPDADMEGCPGIYGDSKMSASSSWLDRLPFVLLFGIATSAENFEERLSGNSSRYLEGQKFDVTQSDEIIERLFAATIASTDICLQIGPNLCRRMLDRQKDHVQNTQDFCDGLKYAYMSHFYASLPSIFLKQGISFEELSADAFEAVRNVPSFRRWVEDMLEDGHAQDVQKALKDNKYLFGQISQHVQAGQQTLATLSHASKVLACIRESLQMSPSVRLSAIWTRAAAGELAGSPLVREIMLSIKKVPSDKLVHLLGSLKEMEGAYFSMGISDSQQKLDSLLQNADAPLRTQHDVRNESMRTTVVAQKVLLSKHKAALSEQDKAYSDLVTDFHDKLEGYFTSSFVEPKTLFLSEVLMYDLKSPHTEVFQPKPRLAVERALATPHDYLGCECCSGIDGNPAALSATQPATAIVYQMYLESGTLINVSDLWSAFNAIAGDGIEENEPNIMALFQRALAELRYLGLVKPSRKKTDHISKIMWKGL
ncbi:hypothetical protein CFE70_001190 [Pyrenophora teres f. teres 0-1]